MLLRHPNQLARGPRILNAWEIGSLLWGCRNDRHLGRLYQRLETANTNLPATIGSVISSLHRGIFEAQQRNPTSPLSMIGCIAAVFDKIHEKNEGTVRQHYIIKPKVAARVESIHTIDGADKVRSARVDIGELSLKNIVFGDSTLEAGEMVVAALKGAHIYREDREGRIDVLRPGHYNFINSEGERVRAESEALLCSPLESALRVDDLTCNLVARLPLDRGIKPGDAVRIGSILI